MTVFIRREKDVVSNVNQVERGTETAAERRKLLRAGEETFVCRSAAVFPPLAAACLRIFGVGVSFLSGGSQPYDPPFRACSVTA